MDNRHWFLINYAQKKPLFNNHTFLPYEMINKFVIMARRSIYTIYIIEDKSEVTSSHTFYLFEQYVQHIKL